MGKQGSRSRSRKVESEKDNGNDNDGFRDELHPLFLVRFGTLSFTEVGDCCEFYPPKTPTGLPRCWFRWFRGVQCSGGSRGLSLHLPLSHDVPKPTRVLDGFYDVARWGGKAPLPGWTPGLGVR